MCGINGFISFDRFYDMEQMRALVHGMNEQIIHRGPDSEGLYADDRCALGMRRLSILDIQGGSQPIWNEARDKMIVFNGELYNYRYLKQKLRQQGHRFTTESDTEVVLHGFEKYGTDFLKQMEGMFAFAIYDTKKATWTLARDRIGEKPLYYYASDRMFLFGSELKSLLHTGLVPKEIDSRAMSVYFQLTYIPAPSSIIQNVRKLPPATVMTIDAQGNTGTETYWSLSPVSLGGCDDYETCKKRLRDALFRSVEQRMISDVPLGAFLSGGFDSTIIVGIMAQLSNVPVNTFNIAFQEKELDESYLAQLTADKHKTNHHILTLNWQETLADLDQLIANIDEPFADSSLIATYAVSKLAKEFATVVLTGDAGDELFAGYNKYLISYYGKVYRKIPKIIRKGIIEPISHKMPSSSSLTRQVRKVIQNADLDLFEQRKRLMSLGFKEEELHQLILDGQIDSMAFIRQDYERFPQWDEQTRTQYVDLMTVLEGDMLAKVDRASMLASVETRVPMLDTQVVELAFQLPTEYKINKTARKRILKDAFRDLIPEELFHTPKHGFGVPIGKWLETELKNKLYFYADEEFLKQQGLFSAEYIHRIIENHMSHLEDRYSELWTFYVFQNWYERMIMS